MILEISHLPRVAKFEVITNFPSYLHLVELAFTKGGFDGGKVLLKFMMSRWSMSLEDF